MANIQPSLKGWSTTEASNQPDSTDSATIAGDLRAIQAGIRQYFTQDTIASASTTDLGSKEAGTLTISGTTTITSLGTVSAGIRKKVVFSGALTLTHNATSLILPGGANITTAANDRAEFESLGTGNWRCNWYQKANGAPIQEAADGDKGDMTVASGVWTLDSTAVTGKTAETSPAIDDLLLLSDTSESAALNKMTLQDMLKVINGLTEDTSPDRTADYLLSYDASASAVKKILMGRAGVVSGTSTVTTSGTSVTITGLPSNLSLIALMLNGVSTNGSSSLMLQLGDSGGIETTGYNSNSSVITTGVATTFYNSGIGIRTSSAPDTVGGVIILAKVSGTTWIAGGVLYFDSTTATLISGCTKTLSDTLTQIRITTVGGSDTFDTGAINYIGF